MPRRKSISNLSLINTFHATSSGVAQDWQIAGRGNDGISLAELIGKDVKPEPESSKAYSAPSKLATVRVFSAGTIILMYHVSVG